MDSSMFNDMWKGLVMLGIILFLVGGACGAGCMYFADKAQGYRVHIEKVEKN